MVLVELAGITRLNWREGYASGDEALRAAARVIQQFAARHGGTACRCGGIRLGLISPGAGEQEVGILVDEVLASLSSISSVYAAAAAWRPGDDGEAVIARARASLSSPG